MGLLSRVLPETAAHIAFGIFDRVGARCIAGPSSFDHIVDSFSRGIALRGQSVERLRHRIEQRIFGSGAFWGKLSLDSAPAARIPQLVIHDRLDRSIPVTESAAVARAAQSTVFVTEGVGHARILEHPTVVTHVVDFALGPRRAGDPSVLACSASHS